MVLYVRNICFCLQTNRLGAAEGGPLGFPSFGAEVNNCVRRGVRSDAQLSPTETRFQKCSQSGKNGSKHPMLSISIAYNVISCKKIEKNTQKIKIADFTM